MDLGLWGGRARLAHLNIRSDLREGSRLVMVMMVVSVFLFPRKGEDWEEE